MVQNASEILLNQKDYYGAYGNMTTFVRTIYKQLIVWILISN